MATETQSDCGISPAAQVEELEGDQTPGIDLKALIPEKVRNFQEDAEKGLEMKSRRFSNLNRNSMSRPKVDLLSELAEERYTTLYEQMEAAISERDEIQRMVINFKILVTRVAFIILIIITFRS